jgi:hypothetical protein
MLDGGKEIAYFSAPRFLDVNEESASQFGIGTCPDVNLWRLEI